MGRDSNIYGADDCGTASRIASQALDTSGTGARNINQSDYWGDTKDESAKSKGNTDAREEQDTVTLRKQKAGSTFDGEKLNMSKGGQRHRKGPSS